VFIFKFFFVIDSTSIKLFGINQFISKLVIDDNLFCVTATQSNQ